MLIGEVAERSGVSAKTIRYYEEIGLAPAPSRTPAGYRDYDEEIIDRLGFVRAAQAAGLTLGEIRGIVSMRDDGETPCGHVLELLRTRTRELDRTIRDLRSLRRVLRFLVDRAARLDPEDCDPRRVCHLLGTV
jgi:DNA-binding transcriptional MerR regulator